MELSACSALAFPFSKQRTGSQYEASTSSLKPYIFNDVIVLIEYLGKLKS